MFRDAFFNGLEIDPLQATNVARDFSDLEQLLALIYSNARVLVIEGHGPFFEAEEIEFSEEPLIRQQQVNLVRRIIDSDFYSEAWRQAYYWALSDRITATLEVKYGIILDHLTFYRVYRQRMARIRNSFRPVTTEHVLDVFNSRMQLSRGEFYSDLDVIDPNQSYATVAYQDPYHGSLGQAGRELSSSEETSSGTSSGTSSDEESSSDNVIMFEAYI